MNTTKKFKEVLNLEISKITITKSEVKNMFLLETSEMRVPITKTQFKQLKILGVREGK